MGDLARHIAIRLIAFGVFIAVFTGLMVWLACYMVQHIHWA